MQHQLEELSLAEKQLISTLNWFRSHYALYQGLDQDRPATLSAVEQFGRDWIGRFKENWGPAFVTLSEKEIISFEGGSYQFTPYGSQVKEDLEMVFPFYQMEYDNFFDQAENSNSHQKFCERVYGLNLTQHG
ncbi:MAG: hypothetical protein KDC24_07565, partial [Saprospiraceae bacterium]|nr:hypothetical protein [Saprospiraceae bacterium]